MCSFSKQLVNSLLTVQLTLPLHAHFSSTLIKLGDSEDGPEPVKDWAIVRSELRRPRHLQKDTFHTGIIQQDAS